MKVLVECDTGMGRCGVQTPAEALELARIIDQSAGLRFGGLMTYPAAGKPDEAEQWLYSARELLEANGLPCETISSGGTPDMWRKPSDSVVTEYRPGTYIYFDRYQVEKGLRQWMTALYGAFNSRQPSDLRTCDHRCRVQGTVQRYTWAERFW